MGLQVAVLEAGTPRFFLLVASLAAVLYRDPRIQRQKKEQQKKKEEERAAKQRAIEEEKRAAEERKCIWQLHSVSLFPASLFVVARSLLLESPSVSQDLVSGLHRELAAVLMPSENARKRTPSDAKKKPGTCRSSSNRSGRASRSGTLPVRS